MAGVRGAGYLRLNVLEYGQVDPRKSLFTSVAKPDTITMLGRARRVSHHPHAPIHSRQDLRPFRYDDMKLVVLFQ